ncbi:hypothetical protein AB1Y20_017813 [Prymnesium parvum]|uniref:cellulase n=1 Tax=Prymnesium parvum TaxID=97485 RepID=A0AB34JLQ2_PRYPA
MLALALLLPPQHVRPLAHHNYREALWKSLLFFRAQRSGDLGPDNPIPWRSAPSFASDGADVGVNLSRGYFDAGDYVKYAQPAAFTLSLLSWGALEFERGLRAAGALAELRAAVRWGADFILQAAAHVERRCTYYAQVGRGAADRCARPSCKYDHGYWGRAEEYASYEYARQRRTYSIDADRPGTEAWAGASAALAAAHQLLARDDPPYAARLLQVARKLFSCATAHNPLNAKLQEALPQVSPQYTSWGFSDELGWAAAWLYDATHEEQYADAFKVGMRRGEDRWWYEGFAASWDDVNALAKLKMLTAKPGYAEAEHLRSSLLDYIRKWRKCSGETRKMTACGLCYAQKWGSLRYAMTSALVAAVYATHFPEDKAEGAPAAEWASGQLHYLLGDNSLGRSYMIGYAGRQGQLSYPRRPHHRGASCPPASEGGCDETALCDPCDSPWVLHGAVVGGPDETDCWNDDRSNWERNEVALDYSAPLPGLLAWMLSLEAGDSEKRWPAQLPLSVAVQSHGVLFRQPQAPTFSATFPPASGGAVATSASMSSQASHTTSWPAASDGPPRPSVSTKPSTHSTSLEATTFDAALTAIPGAASHVPALPASAASTAELSSAYSPLAAASLFASLPPCRAACNATSSCASTGAASAISTAIATAIPSTAIAAAYHAAVGTSHNATFLAPATGAAPRSPPAYPPPRPATLWTSSCSATRAPSSSTECASASPPALAAPPPTFNPAIATASSSATATAIAVAAASQSSCVTAALSAAAFAAASAAYASALPTPAPLVEATRGVFESLGGSPLAVGALLVLGYLCYSYRQRASFQRGRGSGRRSHIHFKSMPPRDVEIDSDMQDSFSDPNEFSQPKGSSSYTSLTSPYLQNSTFGLQEEEGLTFGLHPRVDDEHEVVFRTSVSPRGHIEMRPPGTAVSSELSPLHRHTECPVFRSRRVIPSHPIMGAQVMWWYSALAQAKEQVQSNDARALGSPSSQAGAEWATSAELD